MLKKKLNKMQQANICSGPRWCWKINKKTTKKIIFQVSHLSPPDPIFFSLFVNFVSFWTEKKFKKFHLFFNSHTSHHLTKFWFILLPIFFILNKKIYQILIVFWKISPPTPSPFSGKRETSALPPKIKIVFTVILENIVVETVILQKIVNL